MAGPLSDRRRLFREPSLLVALLLVLLLHAAALLSLRYLIQPPSLLRAMAPPFYTRTIVPEAPPVQAVAAVAAATPSQARPARPVARIRRARAPDAGRAKRRAAAKAAKRVESTDEELASTPPPALPEPPASAPELAASSPEPPASAPESATAALAAPDADAAPTLVPEPEATAAASEVAVAGAPAFLATWPSDTRLSYTLGGNYRGELHGSARVLWQREGTRYHAAVEMSAGLLASLSFSSQGEITAGGLMPEVYEEDVRGRRRGVRIGEDVRLNNGRRVPRPEAVQDTASQFVELGHRFSTGQVPLVPGAQVRFAMARPGGIDDWIYDVVGEEVLYLPRLGPVATFHLKPRPLAKPRGPITAEIWYAPSLQYLPVRIKITQGPETYIDLLVDTIEQR